MLDASHQVKLRHQAARPAAPGPGPTRKPVVKPGEHPCACDEKDEDVTRSSRRTLDRFFNAWLGHLTAGVSPASIMGAYADWKWHLAMSPGKQGQPWKSTGARLCVWQLTCPMLPVDANANPASVHYRMIPALKEMPGRNGRSI